MSSNLEEIIRAFTLLNAVKYNGKASTKAVLGQIFGRYPEFRKDKAEVFKLVDQIVTKINQFSIDTIKDEISKLSPEFTETEKGEEKKELPPLPNVDKKVVMRLAPFPSGPLHIGNARMVILNDQYVKRYKGKLLLVFDDTIGSEQKRLVPEAYDMIVESLEYLDVKVHEKIFKSDRIEGTYEYCRKAIEQGIAYICTCPAERWREEHRLEGKPCPHQNQPTETNLDEWEKMLDGIYDQGEAVARLKIGMDNPDPAVRDPVMMRISKTPHPRVGSKYIVWPLLEFSWAIDDHLLGITHILRGKDLYKEDYIEKWVWEKFKWPIIEFIHYGLFRFEGITLSKTYSRQMIESGNYRGWNDPRTWSIQSLIKRGIQPSAIRESILSYGLSLVDIIFDPLNFYSINKDLIDSKAPRVFFVPNPVKVIIKKITISELTSHPYIHPSFPERGTRNISVPISNGTAQVYITKSDASRLKIDTNLRLKDLCNIKILGKNSSIEAEFTGKEMKQKKIKKIQWVPIADNVKIQVLKSDGTLVEGFGESGCKDLELNQIIHLERFGLGQVNQIKPSILIYYAHK